MGGATFVLLFNLLEHWISLTHSPVSVDRLETRAIILIAAKQCLNEKHMRKLQLAQQFLSKYATEIAQLSSSGKEAISECDAPPQTTPSARWRGLCPACLDSCSDVECESNDVHVASESFDLRSCLEESDRKNRVKAFGKRKKAQRKHVN